MKRLLAALFISLVAGLVSSSVASANVNNFQILDYQIDYQLSRDSSGRSVLETTETITAQFPPNQNRGIERVIPKNYDGHSTSLQVDSITSGSDQQLEYSTRTDEAGNLVIRIGDPDQYVEGRQVYRLVYSQRDVTGSFNDTKSDELYWDTNGTDWQVPIDNLSVSLTVDEGLIESLSGRTACYVGEQGSDKSCQLNRTDNRFTAAASSLAPGENLTLAVGFDQNTFAAYQMSLLEKLFTAWAILQAILTVVGIGLIIWLGIRYSNWSNRRSELNPIVPEYLPPKDASVEVSGKLVGSYSSFAALLIDMAVRRYINIREVKPKKGWTPAEYELEIIKPLDDLRAEEKEVLSDIFQGKLDVGSRLNLKKLQTSTKIYTSLQDNPAKLKQLIRGDYGLRSKNPRQSGWFKRLSIILLVVGVLLLSPIILIVALIAFIMSHTLHPLTDKGLALLRHLEGLKMYIKVAEAERLKMLQSPEGAAKVGDLSDEGRLVKLYERVLPYAILFGLEKDWNKQLGHYYQAANQQPDWFISDAGTAFTAGAFAGAISSFKTTSTYSSHSSSSSGGSTGGGFSGGGGGGGGGGGW